MKANNPLINGTRGTIDDMVYRQVQGDTIVGKKPYRNDPGSESQSAARTQFGGSSATWKTLSAEGRASYSQVAATMKTKSGKPMTGKNLYVKIVATLALTGDSAPALCPQPPLMPPTLPSPLFLSSSNIGGTFTLQIHSAAYGQPVLVEAIQAVSAGVELFKTKSFRIVEVDDNLATPTTSIGNGYAAKFGKPFAGTQIAVRLTPLSGTGYRGTPIIYSAFVAASQAEHDADLEARREKAALKKRGGHLRVA